MAFSIGPNSNVRTMSWSHAIGRGRPRRSNSRTSIYRRSWVAIRTSSRHGTRPTSSARSGSPSARALLDRHRADDHLLIMTTATSRFLTAPIARELGLENLIATEPEIQDGFYTGKVAGTPNMREGKVTRLEAWLGERGLALAGFRQSWFYSDSINDLPLLLRVTHPVAVNPDPPL